MSWRRMRSGLIAPAATGAAGKAPDELGTAVYAWYRGDTRDADPVGSWTDKSGNGRHLAQSTTARKPSISAADSAFNSQDVLDFDGNDDFVTLASGSWGSLAQPYHIFTVVLQEVWVSNNMVFSGNTGNSYCVQKTVSPDLRLYAGSAEACPVSLSLNTAFLLQSYFNGASSFQAIDNGSQVTGNPGSGTMTGFTVGTWRTGTALCGDIRVAEIAVFAAEITGADLTDLKDYFNARYALW